MMKLNAFYAAFSIAVSVSACGQSTESGTTSQDKGRYAANNVFHAFMSGALDLPGHEIPSAPAGEAKCDILRQKVTEAFAAVEAGLYDIKSGGVRQVQGLDVSVAYFDGAAKDLAVLDEVKAAATSCYAAQPGFVGDAGAFIVTAKTDLGGGNWRYEVDPTTARLNAGTQGAGSVAAATWEDSTPTSVFQVSLTGCTALSGAKPGDPAVTANTPEGAVTSLFLLACKAPNLGKFKATPLAP